MRAFVLYRHEDPSGISGTGEIAEGVEFTDGTVVMRWLSEYRSTTIYPSIYEVESIHGHQGSTVVMWEEDPD